MLENVDVKLGAKSRMCESKRFLFVVNHNDVSLCLIHVYLHVYGGLCVMTTTSLKRVYRWKNKWRSRREIVERKENKWVVWKKCVFTIYTMKFQNTWNTVFCGILYQTFELYWIFLIGSFKVTCKITFKKNQINSIRLNICTQWLLLSHKPCHSGFVVCSLLILD